MNIYCMFIVVKSHNILNECVVQSNQCKWCTSIMHKVVRQFLHSKFKYRQVGFHGNLFCVGNHTTSRISLASIVVFVVWLMFKFQQLVYEWVAWENIGDNFAYKSVTLQESFTSSLIVLLSYNKDLTVTGNPLGNSH